MTDIQEKIMLLLSQGYTQSKIAKETGLSRGRIDQLLQPEKHRARRSFHKALKCGTIFPGFCEVCGAKENIHGHHTDYSKPLEVMWLCRKHHIEIHYKK